MHVRCTLPVSLNQALKSLAATSTFWHIRLQGLAGTLISKFTLLTVIHSCGNTPSGSLLLSSTQLLGRLTRTRSELVWETSVESSTAQQSERAIIRVWDTLC